MKRSTRHAPCSPGSSSAGAIQPKPVSGRDGVIPKVTSQPSAAAAQAGRECGVECRDVQHQMVGGADPEDRLGPERRLRPQRREGDGGRGVARRRLQQKVVQQRRIDRLVLAADQHRLAGRRDGDHAPGRRHVECAAHRGLQQGLLAEQLDQMLGEGRTAHRPQTRTRTAGQDGGSEGGGKGERHG